MRFTGRVAIVTGAGSGIGRATAARLAAEGARLVLVDWSAEGLAETVAQLPAGTEVMSAPLDVSQEAQVQSLVERVMERFGQIDVLCNNAGISGSGYPPIDQQDRDEWARLLDVNLIGPMLLSKHVAPSMKARRQGAIVNTASVAGLRSGAGGNAYSASKAALINLTMTCACDLGEWNVRVNAVCPGLVETGMTRQEAAQHGVYRSTDKVYPTEMVVKNPINSWEDFTKLKIRSSGALQKFLDEAGASTTYLPGGELYPALDTGVVDGAHWGAAQGAASMSFYEVAKYHVKPALNIAGTDVIIVSQKALDKLSERDQEIVKQVLDEQFWYRTNEYLYQEQMALQKAIKEQGVQVNVLPEDVQARLREVAKKTWEEEGKRSEKAAEALEKLKTFLADLGYL